MLLVLMTVLLLAPPLVIAAFWWSSVRRQRADGGFPDGEGVVLARACGVACTVLPVVQVLAGIVRYKTGEIGTVLWFGVAIVGVLLAVGALAAFLANARGTERLVSSAMVLTGASLLLLLTMLGRPTHPGL